MADYEVHSIKSEPKDPAHFNVEVVREYSGWFAWFFAQSQCRSLNKLVAMIESRPSYTTYPSEIYYAVWDVRRRVYVT